MHKIHTFAINSIQSGGTVLIYKGWTAKTAKQVTDAGRLEMRGDVMYCDGVSCKGMTVALKPEKWNARR